MPQSSDFWYISDVASESVSEGQQRGELSDTGKPECDWNEFYVTEKHNNFCSLCQESLVNTISQNLVHGHGTIQETIESTRRGKQVLKGERKVRWPSAHCLSHSVNHKMKSRQPKNPRRSKNNNTMPLMGRKRLQASPWAGVMLVCFSLY